MTTVQLPKSSPLIYSFRDQRADDWFDRLTVRKVTEDSAQSERRQRAMWQMTANWQVIARK